MGAACTKSTIKQEPSNTNNEIRLICASLVPNVRKLQYICQDRHCKAFVCNTTPITICRTKAHAHKTCLCKMVIHEEKKKTLANAHICNFLHINSCLK